MKLSTTSYLLAVAMSVAGEPCGHQSFHDKRVPQSPFVKSTQSESGVGADVGVGVGFGLQAATNSPAAQSTAPQGTQNKQSTDSSTTSAAYIPFCQDSKGTVSKRATEAQDTYQGTTGDPQDSTNSAKFGCNMMKIPSTIAHMYDYTATFHNVGNQIQNCTCWLKTGKKDLTPNSGGWRGQSVFDFILAPDEKQAMATMSNSQGACACSPNTLLETHIGQYAGTSLEFDMADKPNGGTSGADASCLVAAAANEKLRKAKLPELPIPGLRVCKANSNDRCSIIHKDGKGENSFRAGMAHENGWGVHYSPGQKVALLIDVDYQG